MRRRRFIGTLAAAPILALGGGLLAETALTATRSLPQSGMPEPNSSPFPDPGRPGQGQWPGNSSPFPQPGNNPPFPSMPNARHAILVEHQKRMKKDVARLYDLADKLRKKVAKTNSTEVLSLDMIRTAEEIQKLAKQIINLAKG